MPIKKNTPRYIKTFWNSEFRELRNDERKVVKKAAQVLLYAYKVTGGYGNLENMLNQTLKEWINTYCNIEEKEQLNKILSGKNG